jgi:hypothetical protein
MVVWFIKAVAVLLVLVGVGKFHVCEVAVEDRSRTL